MGAFGDAFAAYTQPLIDEGDGSREEIETAFLFGQLCWNLALAPEDSRQEMLDNIQPTLKMDDGEFEGFKASVVFPMIQRHYDMFPDMHKPAAPNVLDAVSPRAREASIPAEAGNYPGTPRNAPCPCNSGKKYKRCCGRMY